jgi:hypothetical protein
MHLRILFVNSCCLLSPSRESIFKYYIQAAFAGAKSPPHLSALTNRTQRILHFQEAKVFYKVHAMRCIVVLFILQLDAKLTLQTPVQL